ncbi:MAG: transcriptional repressor, partial [Bacilli bacterium]|nr:transcriptional repressor [Bacilli bacterium]
NNGYLYDIDTTTHGHFICEKCGCIIDLYDDEYQNLEKDIESKYHITIKNSNYVFNGICKNCQNK